MRIEILGSAAGGGFPQWNCNCRNCQALRAGTFRGKSRTQTQVALSADNDSWFLLNASPDLRLQIEACPRLHPRQGLRQSPIQAVVLTSADIDNIAGLLSLRELQPFSIYCTSALRKLLTEHNIVFNMLNRVPNQALWKDIYPGERFPLLGLGDEDSGIFGEALPVGCHYPAYISVAREAELTPEQASLGLLVESAGKRMAYLPAVASMDDSLLARLETTDLVLFDGTFWNDDELIQVQGSGPTARQMGHVPVSGPEGSLQKLAGLKRPRKMFIHVNNTNPMLDESSPQYRDVQNAGWEIAEDGLRVDL